MGGKKDQHTTTAGFMFQLHQIYGGSRSEISTNELGVDDTKVLDWIMLARVLWD